MAALLERRARALIDATDAAGPHGNGARGGSDDCAASGTSSSDAGDVLFDSMALRLLADAVRA